MPTMPVEFPTSDGLLLRGHRSGDTKRWAILVHGEGQDLDAWRGLLGPLRRAGFSVLAFDLRGHGASDDPWDPGRAPADVLAALTFAESQGAGRLLLVGAGVGAAAALVAAGARHVSAVVVLSPRCKLPEATLRQSKAPKLVIVGSLDREAAREAEVVYRRSIGWRLLESPPVEEQGTDLLTSAWGEHVREHLLAFLGRYS